MFLCGLNVTFIRLRRFSYSLIQLLNRKNELISDFYRTFGFSNIRQTCLKIVKLIEINHCFFINISLILIPTFL